MSDLEELQKLQTKIIGNLSAEIDVLHKTLKIQSDELDKVKAYADYLVERMNEMYDSMNEIYDNFGDIVKLENYFRKEKLKKLGQ